MPATITTPNMGLVVPVNLVSPSPSWGQQLMDAFTALDSHDHSPGKGVQVPSAGLNINADLSFGSYNATSFRSVRFTAQSAPLALGSDLGCAYDVNGDLWWNDGSARQIQLTKSGAVNTAPQALSVKSVTTAYTILSTDPYQLFLCQTASVGAAIALPSSALVAPGRTYFFSDIGQNSAANPITLTPSGSDTINGINAAVSVTLNGAMALMTTDGAGNWTFNELPQYAQGSASFTVPIVTGSVTLSALQRRAPIIRFTGTLTGNVTIVFPNAPFFYHCDFSAVVMGAFSIVVQSGSASAASMLAANIGSTQTLSQMSIVASYGGNSIRVRA